MFKEIYVLLLMISSQKQIERVKGELYCCISLLVMFFSLFAYYIYVKVHLL